MLVNQDAKLNPAFWDLVKAMGARGANMQSSTGTMMERIASGENLIGYNILGSYALTRAKKGPVDRHRVHDRLQPRAVASRLRRQEREEPECGPPVGRLPAVEARPDDHRRAGGALFGAHRHDRQGFRRRVRQELGSAVKPIAVNNDLLQASIKPSGSNS
jgi:iron(III) transport system substrate-binding protein